MFELSISAAIIGTVGLLVLLVTMMSLMGVKQMQTLQYIQYGLPVGIFLMLVAGVLQMSNVLNDKLSE